jgi:hypothetical protein
MPRTIGSTRAVLAFALTVAAAGAAWAAGEDTGFFSKQRAFELFGEKVADETVDQRDGAAQNKAMARRVGRDIERLSRTIGDLDSDPISPAEVEGALDAAYAPLVPPVDVNAEGPDPSYAPPPQGDRCAAIRSRPATGPWGLMGALDQATFTWVDGVGKLRTLAYRPSRDGKTMVLSMSMGGRLLPVDTYRLAAPGTATYKGPDGAVGRLTLASDRFTFSADHEGGVFTLDARCNLVLKGALRHNPRTIEDIYVNTTGLAPLALDPEVRERSARRIARLRKDAVIGNARHS